MRGPNLRYGRKQVEKLMIDACIIRRDEGGQGDNTLDRATGSLTRPLDDLDIVYDQDSTGDNDRSLGHETDLGGVFKISPVEGTQTQYGSHDEALIKKYRGSVPLDSPILRQYDFVTVTVATHDQTLVDHTFTIIHIFRTSFAVSRRFLLEERVYGRR